MRVHTDPAIQIPLLLGPPKPMTEWIGFGAEDDESLEGLASPEEMGGVTKAVPIFFQAITPTRSPSSHPNLRLTQNPKITTPAAGEARQGMRKPKDHRRPY